MQTDLKFSIRNALSKSTSQKPVDTAELYKIGACRGVINRAPIHAALMEMYRANEVCCCKITKGGRENVVWWLSGAASLPRLSYNVAIKSAAALLTGSGQT